MGALSNQLTTKGNCCNQAITQAILTAGANGESTNARHQ